MRMIFLASFVLVATAVVWGQTPLQNFVFTRPTSLTGNSGAPYSADEIHEHTKPDASGRLVADPSYVLHIFRDSQGRKRTETPVSRSRLVVVEIEDPDAGFKYILDPEARITHRFKVARGKTYPVGNSLEHPAAAGSQNSSLGTQMIEGLLAVGTRTVVDLEHGPSTIDTWTIPELSVIVLVKSTLPRVGVFTTRLEHIRRVEPDPALFQSPPEYKIVDETGTVSFAITRR